MLILLQAGRRAGETVDMSLAEARAMVADGRAVLPGEVSVAGATVAEVAGAPGLFADTVPHQAEGRQQRVRRSEAK